jgi:hypothetical protein
VTTHAKQRGGYYFPAEALDVIAQPPIVPLELAILSACNNQNLF